MNFLFSGLFWGIIVIIIGISIILNSIFHLDIPIFKIVASLFFIYLGISIITNSSINKSDTKSTIFAESETQKPQGNEYNTIFGSSKIDLSDLKLKDSFTSNTIFGSTIIYIDSKKPINIVASSAFGEIKMPNSNSVNFGEITYTTDTYNEKNNSINIKTSVVFGSVEIKEK